MRSRHSAHLAKSVRAALGFSQEEFARRLGVSKGAVQHWESGRSRPSPRILRQMTGLVPGFAEELRAEIDRFVWHPRDPEGSGRYSEETRQELIAALDMILDNAPSTVVERVSELLTKYAGQHGSPRGRSGQAPSRSEKARVK